MSSGLFVLADNTGEAKFKFRDSCAAVRIQANRETSMREDFDEEEEMSEEAVVPFPGTVRIAGIIWIVIGGLILLNAVANLIITSALAAGQNPGAAAAGGSCPAVVGALIGLAFIFVGQQSVRGTARDTLGNGIGSLGIGLLVSGVGVLAVLGGAAVAGQQAGQQGMILLIIGIVNLFGGIGLLTAGLLALIGRGRYREWKRSQ
jgi:hypothetical protein